MTTTEIANTIATAIKEAVASGYTVHITDIKSPNYNGQPYIMFTINATNAKGYGIYVQEAPEAVKGVAALGG